MLQKNNLNLNYSLKKTIAMLMVFFIFGCSQVMLQPTTLSTLDTQFKFKKLNQLKNESESASVSTYQKILRPSLFSRCDYYPSDSVYSQSLSKKCGTLSSLFKTFHRFILEPDAGNLGLPMINTSHGLQFVDLPEQCEIL